MKTVDICIYGGTSAGVVAAVQAARDGHSALLIEPGRHLGGMTSGGLGCTDIGKDNAVGGIAMEFFRRIGRAYGQTEAAYFFEPKVAERIFGDLIAESGVQVLHGYRLIGAEREEGRITRLTLEQAPSDSINAPASAPAGGTPLAVMAAMFIDASYEGDLLAAAGVQYTVGREAAAQYGESLNGVRLEPQRNAFVVPVDPYVRPGDPDSGVLPLVNAAPPGQAGAADRSVQAYNFRLCLTRDPANRLPIDPPAHYDENRFELLARHIEALAVIGRPKYLFRDGLLLKIEEMPNGKSDVNNAGGLSTDYVGASDRYPDGDYALRGRIWHEHVDYTRGLLHFLATSRRVPARVREEMQQWGLCRDEFQDTGGWPHQLYVREARRMIGADVMTQADCESRRVVPDSVGLGMYPMDSHPCRRIVLNGMAWNDGSMGVLIRKAYPISYRSITPRPAQCRNLLAPVCLSASHVAYGSIRMEPTFMVLAQSAAIAASLALKAGCGVQEVDYDRLEPALLAADQILIWPGGGDGVAHPSVQRARAEAAAGR